MRMVDQPPEACYYCGTHVIVAAVTAGPTGHRHGARGLPQAHPRAEGREVTARARALQERRAALAAALPADLLARYQRLHNSHPPAVVTIHAGTCGGCGVAVPTAMQQKVAAGEILQCLSCSRLLAEG